MSFFRPEVRAAIWRWRELLTGIAIVLLGLAWVLGPGGLLGWLGGFLVLAGLALVLVGVQRGRFRIGTGGPGVVQVNEGQVAYFGPLNGGAVAVADLSRLSLDPGLKPRHWVLEQPGQPPLFIPVNAAGVDALFDMFSTLPGLKTQTVLSALSTRGEHPLVIWQRRPTAPQITRRH